MNDQPLPMASLSILLDGLIDFAGLFPPAKLEMDQMVRAWERGLASEHAWMLGRVIVPVSRLDEFARAAEGRMPVDVDEDPWVISALISPSAEAPFAAQVEAIARFNETWATEGSGGAVVDVVEFKAGGATALDRMLDELPDDLFPFVELPLNEDLRGLLAVLVGSDAGAKVRTGGIRPEFYPDVDQLADFIVQCAKADVPWKATAGLHHPLRRRNEAVPAMEFGFLNVFTAALLARRSEDVTSAEIIPMLTAEDLSEVTFGQDAIQWGEHHFTREEIEDARISFSLSFGSCSFDDPWNDLEALGLLNAEQ